MTAPQSADQCAHVDKVCNLVDRFQQWRGYECPYCEIQRLQQLVRVADDVGNKAAAEIERLRKILDETHTALLNWVTRYNGRPSTFRDAEKEAEGALDAAYEKLDEFLYPDLTDTRMIHHEDTCPSLKSIDPGPCSCSTRSGDA